MNAILAEWNRLDHEAAAREILPCCGSRAWADELALRRPFDSVERLAEASDAVWLALPEAGWLEAFASHPRIGERHAQATQRSLAWSTGEQAGAEGDKGIQAALVEANRRYEERFGRTFIVCATGKSGEEMLRILTERMNNEDTVEMQEAAEQQRQITQLRLAKWLGGA